MLAFIKRRWILLSCAVGLLACSPLNMRPILVVGNSPWKVAGLIEGDFFAGVYPYETSNYYGIHAPRFGSVPSYEAVPQYTEAIVPLWLPLSVVLGWIVWRELRWREKRAKRDKDAVL